MRTSITYASVALCRFIRLGRPVFLLGGFVMYALGPACARWAGSAIEFSQFLAGQTIVTSLQLMTHYANDYFDLDADRANRTPTRWSGGSRVLLAAPVMRSVALAAAVCFLIIGVSVALIFTAWRSSLAVPLLVSAIIVLAWGYSAPPVRLHSTGVGELVAAVVVAALVPWLGCAVQPLCPTTQVVAATLPLVLVQFAMLIVIGIPDREADARVGKRTIVVRLGLRAAALLHNCAIVSAYLVLVVTSSCGLPPVVMLTAALTLPLAALQVLRVARGAFRSRRDWEGLAFGAVSLVLVCGLAELVAILSLEPGASEPTACTKRDMIAACALRALD